MEQLARSLALELRSRGDVADDAAVTEIRDRPTPWLTFEFTLYDFLPSQQPPIGSPAKEAV